MKALILAAGYATRLFPLTKNMPKPLLDIAGRPMINYISDKLNEIEEIDEIYVVTNNKFYEHFNEWAKNYKNKKKNIRIFNDMTLTNEDRLGAIGDIKFVIDNAGIEDDLLIIAGDNLFDFDINLFLDFFRQKKSICLGVYDIEEKEKAANKYGVIKTDEENKIIDFQEKPKEPETSLISMGYYCIPKDKIDLFKEYEKSGNSLDAPGNFIKWAYKNYNVFAYVFDGTWFDIGDFDSLESARKFFIRKGDE